ncbi:WD40/YVTN/BNR-like repeat-containing protein [Cupriavidus basilensis]
MKKLIGVAVSLTVLAAAVWAFSPRPLPAFAPTALRADQLQINGLARAGERLVGVGERGKILLSDDHGNTWRSAHVSPDQAAQLTQLAFANGRGWRRGRTSARWILRTSDGGEHWQQVAFDEKQSDPLLGVAGLQPEGKWFAFGSFGRFMTSHDQGAHWENAAVPAMQDKHLNGLAGDKEGRMMLVGESGLCPSLQRCGWSMGAGQAAL